MIVTGADEGARRREVYANAGPLSPGETHAVSAARSTEDGSLGRATRGGFVRVPSA